MALILNIETSTRNCSVALFNGSNFISEKYLLSEKYSHSEILTLFIEGVINNSPYTLKDLDAISVSKGPGSYTGLRIGVSTAKGLSYSLSKPLISIPTLQSMAFSMSKQMPDFDLYSPMIDARRMEVFSALFDKNNKEVRGVQADVVDNKTYAAFLEKKVLFFGDGALKCKEIINHKNAIFIEGIYPSAKDIGTLADIKFESKDFEDVAYFEPYYLKDFVTGDKKS